MRRSSLWLALAVTAVGVPAVARQVPLDLDRYYPARAREQEIEGYAVIECRVSEAATLENCAVVVEAPVGHGFGEATIRASRQIQLRAATTRGRPVAGATVRIPIRWSLG